MEPFEDFVVSADFGPESDKAKNSALRSMRRNKTDEITSDFLRVWYAEMLLDGQKPSGAIRYISRLRSLYRKWAVQTGETQTSPFDEAILHPSSPESGYARENLKRIASIVKICADSPDYLAAAIFLYLLYDVEASLHDAINSRHEECRGDCGQISEIVAKAPRKSNAAYTFPLGQGQKRATQISRETLAGIRRLLTSHGMKFGATFSRHDITALWIEAAWQAGIPAQQIRNMVDDIPAEYGYLNLLPQEELTPGERSAIICRVADQINERTLRWFVLRLRSGVTPDDIKDTLRRECPTALGDLTFYHPTRKVLHKKEGKRKIYTEEPYLPGILFFRTYRDRVAPLVGRVGRQAWCLKASPAPGSPYSSISAAEMWKFQQHVGAFTPDMEMRLEESSPEIAVGDNVTIIGGNLYEGLAGTVTKTTRINGRTTYTLRLSTSQCIRWTVADIDEALLTPAI